MGGLEDASPYLAVIGLPIAVYILWTVGRIVRARLTRKPPDGPSDDEALSGWG